MTVKEALSAIQVQTNSGLDHGVRRKEIEATDSGSDVF